MTSIYINDSMGFLDDLKRQQAEERAAADRRAKGIVERDLPPHVLAVEPQLEILRDGLRAFSRRLNAALPDIRAHYRIGEFATLDDLRQSAYKVSTEDSEGLRIKFSFLCRRDGAVIFETNNRDICDQTLDHLLSNGLKVKYRSHADWRFVFTLNTYVPVSLEFAPHPSKAAIKLTTRNLHDIGEKFEHLDPERLNETFLDQLKKCVLREPNNFNELCGNEVTEDIRAQFKERIAARQRERETLTEESPAEKKPGKLRGLLGKLTKKD